MHRGSARYTIPVLALMIAGVCLANSTGPPVGVTGAPALGGFGAEPTCNQSSCHVGNPLNQDGALVVLGLPDVYEPGRAYPLTVQLTSSATAGIPTRRWGFELTAVSLNDGMGAGSFSASTLLVRSGGTRSGNREYVTHNSGTVQGGTTSPAQWLLTWSAPATDVGPVAFYLAGNAANGNLLQSGDFIYTGSDTAFAPGTPVKTTTWGRLKAGIR